MVNLFYIKVDKNLFCSIKFNPKLKQPNFLTKIGFTFLPMSRSVAMNLSKLILLPIVADSLIFTTMGSTGKTGLLSFLSATSNSMLMICSSLWGCLITWEYKSYYLTLLIYGFWLNLSPGHKNKNWNQFLLGTANQFQFLKKYQAKIRTIERAIGLIQRRFICVKTCFNFNRLKKILKMFSMQIAKRPHKP